MVGPLFPRLPDFTVDERKRSVTIAGAIVDLHWINELKLRRCRVGARVPPEAGSWDPKVYPRCTLTEKFRNVLFLGYCFYWSERRDLNSGPLAPHASALPDCATFRPERDDITAARLVKMIAGLERLREYVGRLRK